MLTHHIPQTSLRSMPHRYLKVVLARPAVLGILIIVLGVRALVPSQSTMDAPHSYMCCLALTSVFSTTLEHLPCQSPP
jgi:hypothetical protein